MKKYTLILFVLFNICLGYAQDKTYVDSLFKSIEEGTKHKSSSYDYLHNIGLKEIKPFLKKYKKTESQELKIFIQYTIMELSMHNSEEDIPKWSIDILVSYCDDEDMKTRLIAVKNLKLALEKNNNINRKSKRKIERAIEESNFELESILLIGVIGSDKFNDKLSQLAEFQSRRIDFYSTKWYAQLVLARLGNEDYIDRCLNTISSVESEMKKLRLLDDVQYIRNKKSVMFLKNYLVSNMQTPLAHDVIAMPYYQYAMENLHKMLEDFPFERKYRYTLEERDACLEWLNAQTEFKIRR